MILTNRDMALLSEILSPELFARVQLTRDLALEWLRLCRDLSRVHRRHRVRVKRIKQRA